MDSVHIMDILSEDKTENDDQDADKNSRDISKSKSVEAKPNHILDTKTTKDRPHTCDICNKSFTARFTLITHRRTHTGERPYKCEFCSFSFAEKKSLDNHRRIHTGERPYKCDICPKSFSARNTLVGHRRSHTNEKPYFCNVCNKSFAHRSSARYHKKVHEAEANKVKIPLQQQPQNYIPNIDPLISNLVAEAVKVELKEEEGEGGDEFKEMEGEEAEDTISDMSKMTGLRMSSSRPPDLPNLNLTEVTEGLQTASGLGLSEAVTQLPEAVTKLLTMANEPLYQALLTSMMNQVPDFSKDSRPSYNQGTKENAGDVEETKISNIHIHRKHKSTDEESADRKQPMVNIELLHPKHTSLSNTTNLNDFLANNIPSFAEAVANIRGCERMMEVGGKAVEVDLRSKTEFKRISFCGKSNVTVTIEQV